MLFVYYFAMLAFTISLAAGTYAGLKSVKLI